MRFRVISYTEARDAGGKTIPGQFSEVTFVPVGFDPVNKAAMGEHPDGRITLAGGAVGGELGKAIKRGQDFEVTLRPIDTLAEPEAPAAAAPAAVVKKKA